ncbi:MAG: LysE family translocator [Pseudomonadota bacterium]|nr:LysE family translocator [Pseudomonadota bacterium]
MSLHAWFAFIGTSMILIAIPGPTILTVISYSLSQGRRANIPVVAGVALGDSTALALSMLGLGALLAASSFWFAAIKTVGGSYLLYLGIRLLRAGASPEKHLDLAPRMPGWKLFANAYLVAALNPKGVIFYVAFLPQFVNPSVDVARQLWTLALTFVGLAIVNATLYSAFAASARDFLTSPRIRRRFDFVGGSLLSTAGIWALAAKRPS